MVALANTIEPVAWCDHPSIRRRPIQTLAKIFKHGRIVWRYSREIIECLIDTGCQTSGCNIVAKDAAVHDLRIESRLRDELVEQVRNVLLPFRHECFLVTR